MFGLSFGELCVLLIVAVVVLGPKDLPRYLRKAGQLAGKLRRMAYDMREKSGIDEILRTEGIDRDLAEIRKLARGEIAGVVASVRSTTDALRPQLPGSGGAASSTTPNLGDAGASAYAKTQVPGAPLAGGTPDPGLVVDREREYPREGADSYGALPDTALVYDGNLAASPLADDALYTRGEAA